MLTVNVNHCLAHFHLNVRFEVADEIVVLSGPSGSGKTTILNMISGLVKFDGGQIRLHDRILARNGKSLIPVQKRGIGYVFQDYALFPHRTLWQNIQYGMKKEAEIEVNLLMKDLGVTHLINQYPHEISGGEKQRVAMIRALATKPALLLLDEPFAALDEKTRTISHEQLLRIHDQWRIPILLVSHNQAEANKLASKRLYIENGKLA